MTEKEWRSHSFALLFVTEAAGMHQKVMGAEDYDLRRLQLAKAACLQRLGDDMPPDVRGWVDRVDATPDDAPWKVWDRMSFDRSVYEAFHNAYRVADLVMQQRLAAAQDVYHGTDYHGYGYMLEADENHPTYTGPIYAAESVAHCEIIRCVFGPPTKKSRRFPKKWRSESAVTLARTAYDTRNFTLLPILADALEEAGCDNADILTHCRDPKAIHARGCWVVIWCWASREPPAPLRKCRLSHILSIPTRHSRAWVR